VGYGDLVAIFSIKREVLTLTPPTVNRTVNPIPPPQVYLDAKTAFCQGPRFPTTSSALEVGGAQEAHQFQVIPYTRPELDEIYPELLKGGDVITVRDQNCNCCWDPSNQGAAPAYRSITSKSRPIYASAGPGRRPVVVPARTRRALSPGG
jgi:hypothetical protein